MNIWVYQSFSSTLKQTDEVDKLLSQTTMHQAPVIKEPFTSPPDGVFGIVEGDKVGEVDSAIVRLEDIVRIAIVLSNTSVEFPGSNM